MSNSIEIIEYVKFRILAEDIFGNWKSAIIEYPLSRLGMFTEDTMFDIIHDIKSYRDLSHLVTFMNLGGKMDFKLGIRDFKLDSTFDYKV